MLRLLANVDLLLATILVVNNLVNICIVILTAGIIDSVFTFLRFEFLFKTVLVTFLLLLFGEILPKVLAQTIPLRFASMVARPLLVLRWVFYPLSYALVRTSSRISEKAAHKSEISLDELADAVDMTQSSSPEEHVMLSGIVNFVNTEVQEIMKPRVDITALSMTADYETVKRTIIESGFSRIPVYEEDLDNIRGTLYVKDLLPYINNGGDFAWQQLIRKPYFVPEHKKINDLLADFQSNKVHMAIVVDEYGSTLRMPPGSFEAGLRCFLKFSDRLLADRFAAGEGCRAACGGFGTFFLPKWDEYPPPCRKFHKSFFRIGRPRNRTSCRRNPVGRGVIPNVIVIFVTMKQAVTPLRLGSDRIFVAARPLCDPFDYRDDLFVALQHRR